MCEHLTDKGYETWGWVSIDHCKYRLFRHKDHLEQRCRRGNGRMGERWQVVSRLHAYSKVEKRAWVKGKESRKAG